MMSLIVSNGGRIDKIYFCPKTDDKAGCRKPNIGMAMLAKADFPEINFEKSVMIGDSKSDMEFGKKLKMMTIYVSSEVNSFSELVDYRFSNLLEASIELSKV